MALRRDDVRLQRTPHLDPETPPDGRGWYQVGLWPKALSSQLSALSSQLSNLKSQISNLTYKLPLRLSKRYLLLSPTDP